MRACLLIALFCMALGLAWPAEAACRLALALGLDVSGSVDDRDYKLQMHGLAEALSAPDVQSAFLTVPETPVALAVYEWSASSYQRTIIDWRLVDSPGTLDQITAELRAWARRPTPEATGLGAALSYGARLIEAGPTCWDRTLDISGDGKNNDWPVPERLRASGEIAWLRVNALVIAPAFTGTQDRTDSGVAELSSYFQRVVIQGPGAFVEVALGFEDYGEAMRRKLLRELSTLPLGHLPPPLPTRRADLAAGTDTKALQ